MPLTGVATLTAGTVYGVLRGLETFSQLVTFDFQSSEYLIHDGPWEVRRSGKGRREGTGPTHAHTATCWG